MRWLLGCGVLGLLVGLPLASCSGGGGTIDAGPDVVSEPSYDNSVPETTPPAPVVADLVAGAQHTCMIVDYNGQYVTYCFGAAAALGGMANGVLATTANGKGQSPNLLSLTSNHGAGHTCGIDTMKQVWCWGDNTSGQCGQGSMGNTIMAPAVALDGTFGIAEAKAVSAGAQTTCMIRRADGQLACFGDNTGCEMDLYDVDAGSCTSAATSGTATEATDTGILFSSLNALGEGKIHGCVAGQMGDAGAPGLYCFGDNASLESGPSGKSVTIPAAHITSSTIASIGAGDTHTCYVTTAHALYCFGQNDMHQASPTSSTTPIDPTAATPITLPMSAVAATVAVRAAETCVVDLNGGVWCFGSGHGTNIDALAGVKDVAKLALGAGHTCVLGHLTSNKASDPLAVLCWGDNTMGQCGQAAGGTVAMPTAVVYPASAP